MKISDISSSPLKSRASKLAAYLSQAANLPFTEGQHDCALFGAGAVEAQTGIDYAAPYRGRYTTTRGGLRVLRKDGFDDHIALAAHHLQVRPEGQRARPGDLGVVPLEDGPALGVIQGTHVYLIGPNGLWLCPIANAIRIFEV